MKAYHELLDTILNSGNNRGDRTGTGTRSCFGLQFRHNLQEGFPLLTTKRLPFKAIVVELLWFLRGDTNIKYLLENGVHIWTPDAYRMYKRWGQENASDEEWAVSEEEFEQRILNDWPKGFAEKFGDLGPVYGAQWNAWNWKLEIDYDAREARWVEPINQIKNVIESIRENPEGRRHIVSAWNPAEVASMALPPCHVMFQFYVADGKLSCHMYQRSADMFLGVPFNIASYALLTHIIAHQTNLGVGELIISFGDIHIYNNHLEQVKEQLSREPRPLPQLSINKIHTDNFPTWIDSVLPIDFSVDNYKPHPIIKGELSVGI